MHCSGERAECVVPSCGEGGMPAERCRRRAACGRLDAEAPLVRARAGLGVREFRYVVGRAAAFRSLACACAVRIGVCGVDRANVR